MPAALNSPHPRRAFLRGTGTVLAAGWATRSSAANQTDERLRSFDLEMETFMKERSIPGGALAVLYRGRLVLSRGYGLADRKTGAEVGPDSLFRIASISKPFTAAGILLLAQQGRLQLDNPVLPYLEVEPHLPDGGTMDPRWNKITLRHCLQHTGGWDRNASFDPMFRAVQFAEELGLPVPADAHAVIRCMLGRALDFDPGQKYAYSNFGYCLLGRVIEKVTGMSYVDWMQAQVLAPLGIRKMKLGRSLERYRDAREVHYHMPEKDMTSSVFASSPGRVPWPYGGFHLEAMDSHGGWLATAADLVRFAAFPANGKLLRPEWVQEVTRAPAAPVSRAEGGALKETYYGCGWSVRPVRAGKFNIWHGGSLPGTKTLLVRRWDDIAWAVLFNQRQNIPGKPDSAIDPALHRAANAVREWPEGSLSPG